MKAFINYVVYTIAGGGGKLDRFIKHLAMICGPWALHSVLLINTFLSSVFLHS